MPDFKAKMRQNSIAEPDGELTSRPLSCI